MVLWWTTPTECAAALARIDAEDHVEKAALDKGKRILQFFLSSATEVHPTMDVRLSAEHLLSKHPLRAADALQLAAALSWRDSHTAGASFVCLDGRLRQAAGLEGFRVLPYADEVNESVLGVQSGFVLRDRSVPYG
jgi:predicted nucleic acid-binding protein